MLPLGVFGATIATWGRGLFNDVYFQIGFLTTMGLSTKNAILIIQFIKERLAHGEGLVEATLGAARVRLDGFRNLYRPLLHSTVLCSCIQRGQGQAIPARFRQAHYFHGFTGGE